MKKVYSGGTLAIVVLDCTPLSDLGDTTEIQLATMAFAEVAISARRLGHEARAAYLDHLVAEMTAPAPE